MHYCPKIHTKLIARFRPQWLKKINAQYQTKIWNEPRPLPSSPDCNPAYLPHSLHQLEQ